MNEKLYMLETLFHLYSFWKMGESIEVIYAYVDFFGFICNFIFLVKS